ncbi:MAG: ATP-binding protein [Bacteroidota bacterium]|jgi:signal transduction histidine kinase/ActR/RegA family two-component response regulator
MKENELKKVNMNETAEVFGGHTFQMKHTGVQFQNMKAMFELIHDDAKQNKVQNQSFQSLKMRSLGTFAGNIAHDFNNIFGTILASSSLLAMNRVGPEKYTEILKAINNAVGRGAELVNEILIFTGKTDVSFRPLSVPGFINDSLSKLMQTFPENIKFQKMIEQNISCISADKTEMHRMLLNLCINARDAMPEGGTITIRVNSVTRQELQGLFPTVDHDRYICISISDTGTGIEETAKDMIFDPFFTTKEKGKGLGLSVVYGIVKAHHGFIDLESEPGHGSTFYIYFPLMTVDKKNNNSLQMKMSADAGGTETILIVEDEKPLLDLACLLFESKGYTVLAAKNGIEAVEMYRKHREKISLVFTDIVLPGLEGREVFTKLKEMNPSVKVIFTSGIITDIKAALLKDGAKDFIQKPYKQEDVLRKIREVLDAP